MTAAPDFTYQDCDSFVLLTARNHRARSKMATHIQPRTWYGSKGPLIAVLDPEEAQRVRCILTVYEGYRVDTV